MEQDGVARISRNPATNGDGEGHRCVECICHWTSSGCDVCASDRSSMFRPVLPEMGTPSPFRQVMLPQHLLAHLLGLFERCQIVDHEFFESVCIPSAGR